MTLKTKKVKKTEVETLGDEWTVLSEEEITESGIALGEDETLVQEVPETEPPASGDQRDHRITFLESQVRKLNKESASRRLTLRDVTGERDRLITENSDLKKKQGERELAERKDKAKQLFNDYVTEKKHVFVSDVATTDVQEAVFSSVDWTKEVTKEVLSPLIDQQLQKKPYVLKTVELPHTDAGRQSTNVGTVVLDDSFLENVAADFGLPNQPVSKEK